jgi:SPRY domain-containing SOCS box protein 1/4
MIPPKVRELLSRPPVARQTQIDNAWDPAWCDGRVSFTDDGMTCIRGNVPGGAAVRGRRPMTTGVHVWAVTWETGARGYRPVIGVGTDKAAMNDGIGSTDDSWGWNLGNNVLCHGDRPVGRYPSNKDRGRYRVSDTFHLVLDMDEGTLSFVDGDQFLGEAFSGLKGLSLCVMADILGVGASVTIKYLGSSV